MARTYIDKSKEQQGTVPRGGYKLEITGLEITKTGETSRTPGCKMYALQFKVVKPESHKGMMLRDWMVVGTADDPRAKREETWDVATGGPAKMKRLLARSGADVSEDDEEWEDQLIGRTVVAHVTESEDDQGKRNRIGFYFRESDDDCPPIGIDEEGGGRKGRAKPPKKKPADDEDDEKEKDEEDKPKKGKDGKKRPPADDDDDDD